MPVVEQRIKLSPAFRLPKLDPVITELANQIPQNHCPTYMIQSHLLSRLFMLRTCVETYKPTSL